LHRVLAAPAFWRTAESPFVQAFLRGARLKHGLIGAAGS